MRLPPTQTGMSQCSELALCDYYSHILWDIVDVLRTPPKIYSTGFKLKALWCDLFIVYSFVLGLELRVLQMQGKHSSTKPHRHPFVCFLFWGWVRGSGHAGTPIDSQA